MRLMNPIIVAALCALVLAACGKEKSPEQQREEAVAEVQATVDRLSNLPSDPDQAASELQAIGRDMEKRLAEAKANEKPAVADACAFLDDADVIELIGGPYTTEPMARMGSSWGGCNYSPVEVNLQDMQSSRLLMINIRPAGEFQATVDYHGKSGRITEVEGLAGKAYVDGNSLLWQPPGKAWFVFVSGGALGTQDPKFAVDAAKRMEL